MTYICVCGHAEDEHEEGGGECTVMFFDEWAQADAKCICVAYEDNPDAEEDSDGE